MSSTPRRIARKKAAATRPPKRVDGRTLRKVGRTEAMAIKTFPRIRMLIQDLAIAKKMTFIETIEEAIQTSHKIMTGELTVAQTEAT